MIQILEKGVTKQSYDWGEGAAATEERCGATVCTGAGTSTAATAVGAGEGAEAG